MRQRAQERGTMRININDFVKVKLNAKGKDIYYHRDDDARKRYVENYGSYPDWLQPKFPKEDENGYTKFQLWELMQIYGQYLEMTTEPVIGCEIILTVEPES